MFPARFFPNRYFAVRYWPPVGGADTVSVVSTAGGGYYAASHFGLVTPL